MALSTQTEVLLPTGQTTMVIFPGGNGDYKGNWPAAASALETLWNTGGVTGHKWGGLHAIMGSSWNSGSYYNARTMWQGFAGQQFISLPSMFPQYDPSDGNLNTNGTGASPGAVATYDKANLGAYDYYYNLVAAQIVADWPYAVIRIGQEVDGNWFWWGIGPNDGTNNYLTANKGSAAKVKQLLTRIFGIFRAKGFKGYLVVNAGNFNGFDIGTICPDDPSLWDIADCDDYATGNAGSGGSAANQAAAWTQAQLPMIQNTIRAAAAHGKRWGMFETSPNVWRYPINGTNDNGCHDDPFFLQQLHAVIMDTTQPAECAYLCLHNGNDYGNEADRTTIQRRDTLWVTSSVTTTDWKDDTTAPGSLKELRGTAWTVAGLTRTTAPVTPVTPSGNAATLRPPRKWRRTVAIFAPPPAGDGGTQTSSGGATLSGSGALTATGATTAKATYPATYPATY